MACFTKLVTQKAQAEVEVVQQRNHVTYTLPFPEKDAPTVAIIESPLLYCSGTDTGLRTWTAALFLATFLSTTGRDYVENKRILELGAGPGFLSILCGKHLGAKSVLLTDGSPKVIDLAQHNVDLNEAGSVVRTAVLEWGDSDIERILQTEDGSDQYDIILGADMVSKYEIRHRLRLRLFL